MVGPPIVATNGLEVSKKAVVEAAKAIISIAFMVVAPAFGAIMPTAEEIGLAFGRDAVSQATTMQIEGRGAMLVVETIGLRRVAISFGHATIGEVNGQAGLLEVGKRSKRSREAVFRRRRGKRLESVVRYAAATAAATKTCRTIFAVQLEEAGPSPPVSPQISVCPTKRPNSDGLQIGRLVGLKVVGPIFVTIFRITLAGAARGRAHGRKVGISDVFSTIMGPAMVIKMGRFAEVIFKPVVHQHLDIIPALHAKVDGT